MSAICGNALKN